jgi:hypothetical protein
VSVAAVLSNTAVATDARDAALAMTLCRPDHVAGVEGTGVVVLLALLDAVTNATLMSRFPTFCSVGKVIDVAATASSDWSLDQNRMGFTGSGREYREHTAEQTAELACVNVYVDGSPAWAIR